MKKALIALTLAVGTLAVMPGCWWRKNKACCEETTQVETKTTKRVSGWEQHNK